MGLKPAGANVHGEVFTMFQQDLCGIEARLDFDKCLSRSMFQQDLCGIEAT